MLIIDFKITKRIENSKDNCFCRDCLVGNPDVEDSYSTCCNELIADKDDAIVIAKRMDIQKFLGKNFKCVSSRYNFSGPYVIEYVINDSGNRFLLNMSNDKEILIHQINAEIGKTKNIVETCGCI